MKLTSKMIEPWNINFWKRLKYLTDDNSKKKKKRVAYIYEKADTSTFRYRVYNMFQALSQSKSWVGTYFFEDELSQLTEYLEKIDIVIFARTRWSLQVDQFVNLIKKKNIPTAFDMDDLIFDTEKLPLITSTLNVDFDHPECYSYWFSYSSRLWLMGKMCDATIGTNDYLGKKLTDTFNKPSFVINNFLNNEQIAISDKLFKKKKRRSSKNRFTLGYFSGTPSHINDFRTIAPEIDTLLKKHPDITLQVVGFMEFPNYLSPFVANKQIVHSPLVDYLTLQKKIAEVDINIVPLVDNEFTNCKSELKFFEAAVVGTLTCATPTYVYRNNIENEKNGFMCRGGDWYRTIEKIYKDGIDSKIILRARGFCLKKYSSEKQLPNIENVLEEVYSLGSKKAVRKRTNC